MLPSHTSPQAGPALFILASLKSWHQTQACVSRIPWNGLSASQSSRGCLPPAPPPPEQPGPLLPTAPISFSAHLVVGGRFPCVGQPGTILRCINKSPCLGLGWGKGGLGLRSHFNCSPGHPGDHPTPPAGPSREAAWPFSISSSPWHWPGRGWAQWALAPSHPP